MTLKSIQVVQEFSNVFFEDLLGLPLDRDLEFGIELLPRSALIFILSYRMAPIELNELKTQL